MSACAHEKVAPSPAVALLLRAAVALLDANQAWGAVLLQNPAVEAVAKRAFPDGGVFATLARGGLLTPARDVRAAVERFEREALAPARAAGNRTVGVQWRLGD